MKPAIRRSIPFLEGERIFLRPLEESDIDDGPYLSWLNDERVCAGNSHHAFPYSRLQAQQFIREAAVDSKNVILAIATKPEGAHIGNVSLGGINQLARVAQFSILLGESNHWGKGFGLEAARLLFSHGFRALNLQKIECGTYAVNTGMLRLAQSLGMHQEGVRRRAAWKDGAYVDIIEFGILREEFLVSP